MYSGKGPLRITDANRFAAQKVRARPAGLTW
jgi:hypothetical protein